MAGGGTLREHLEQVAKQTGKTPRQLQDLPELWPAAEHIWEWFMELWVGIDQNNISTVLSYREIKSWEDAKGIKIKFEEIETLRLLSKSMFDPN